MYYVNIIIYKNIIYKDNISIYLRKLKKISIVKGISKKFFKIKK